MPFKTPSKNSEYIRTILRSEKDERVKSMMRYADDNMIPVLLPESAVLLEQLITLKKPSRVLEIGMAVGYSTQIMLRAGAKHVSTIEINEDYALKGKAFLNELGYEGRYKVFLGDASDVVPFLDGSYDFIFMDGPKTRYIEYWTHLKHMLCPGGVMLADNVLFNGMVADSEKIQHSKLTIINGLDKFLRTICDDPDFTTSILPVGDGMSLTIKKDEKN